MLQPPPLLINFLHLPLYTHSIDSGSNLSCDHPYNLKIPVPWWFTQSRLHKARFGCMFVFNIHDIVQSTLVIKSSSTPSNEELFHRIPQRECKSSRSQGTWLNQPQAIPVPRQPLQFIHQGMIYMQYRGCQATYCADEEQSQRKWKEETRENTEGNAARNCKCLQTEQQLVKENMILNLKTMYQYILQLDIYPGGETSTPDTHCTCMRLIALTFHSFTNNKINISIKFRCL